MGHSMNRWGVIALVWCASFGMCVALADDEAPPSTQPATQPASAADVVFLKSVIADQAKTIRELKVQVAQLKASDAALNRQLAAMPRASTAPAPRAGEPRIKVGMTLEECRKVRRYESFDLVAQSGDGTVYEWVLWGNLVSEDLDHNGIPQEMTAVDGTFVNDKLVQFSTHPTLPKYQAVPMNPFGGSS